MRVRRGGIAGTVRRLVAHALIHHELICPALALGHHGRREEQGQLVARLDMFLVQALLRGEMNPLLRFDRILGHAAAFLE